MSFVTLGVALLFLFFLFAALLFFLFAELLLNVLFAELLLKKSSSLTAFFILTSAAEQIY
jgi:hypothetical protein